VLFRSHAGRMLRAFIASNRHLCLDMGVRVVAGGCEVLVLELEDRAHRGVDLHVRQRARRARELEIGLIKVVQKKVRIRSERGGVGKRVETRWWQYG